MNESGTSRPGPSLAVRRAALLRARVLGLIGILVGGLYGVLGVSLLLESSGKPIYLFQLALGLALLGFGIWRFLSARRDLRRLPEADGPHPGSE